MSNIQAVTRQDQRPFCELVRHCEIRAIASRIAAAVVRFFIEIVNIMCCCCRSQGQPISVQRDELIPARIPTIETTRPPLNIHFNQNLVNNDTYDKMHAEKMAMPLIQMAMPLIQPGMDAQRRSEIIATIAHVHHDERESVVTYSTQLIDGDLDIPHSWGRENLIKAVAAIPAREREDVISRVQRLLPPNPERLNQDTFKRWIMESVAGIPMRERDGLIQHAFRLITPEMGALVISGVISNIARIPALEREGVVQHVREFTTRQGSINQIIKAVAAIPALERDAAMQRARAWITPEMRAHDIVMMIERAAPQQPDAVYHPAPAEGVNVHEGDRDRQTRAAVLLVREHQGEVSTTELEQAKNEFIKYLEGFRDPVAKRLADDALRKDRGDEHFGPLIGGEGFAILNLPVTGEEILGRLWIYATKIKNNKDQENAKIGMVRELARCYNEDGTRICNPGKTQHLILAVLQGRLEGVDVDGVPLTRGQAVTAFLQAHADIQVRTQLLAAVPLFRLENTIINRDQLIEDIHAYADGAEMPSLKDEFIAANPNLTTLADFNAAANRFCDENPLINRAAFLANIEAHANQVANTA